MKTSISSEMWESQKQHIVELYQDEELPLKLVLNKIRTKDFLPTETQLRSRLKKWGIRKRNRKERRAGSSRRPSSISPASMQRAALHQQQGHHSPLMYAWTHQPQYLPYHHSQSQYALPVFAPPPFARFNFSTGHLLSPAPYQDVPFFSSPYGSPVQLPADDSVGTAPHSTCVSPLSTPVQLPAAGDAADLDSFEQLAPPITVNGKAPFDTIEPPVMDYLRSDSQRTFNSIVPTRPASPIFVPPATDAQRIQAASDQARRNESKDASQLWSSPELSKIGQ